jgi:hypothetical protein
LSSLARADSSNLLPNGSFQSGTSNWKATDAAFTIESDGASDAFAGRLALNTTARSYQLATKPRPVLNTSAGLVYTANGVVRSDSPGKSVCLLLKEFTSGGTLVLKSDDCTLTGSQWAPLPQVALTAQNDGDSIVLIIRRPSGAVAGESFEVDDLSLVASGDSTPPPPPPPASVVGLWHLDEPSGTTAFDSSGQGHNGAISGPVTLGVPGELNTAYSFVPKSAIIVPDAPDLRPGTANVTISYWLKATTPPSTGDYDMFVKGEAGSSPAERAGIVHVPGFGRQQATAGGAERDRRALAPGDLPAHRRPDHRDRRRRNTFFDEGDRLDHGHRSGSTRLARKRGRLVPRRPRRSHILDRLEVVPRKLRRWVGAGETTRF